MRPFLVNMGTDNKNQRANGRNVADLRMKLGMLQVTGMKAQR